MSSSTILLCSNSEKAAILNVFGKTAEDITLDVSSIKEWMSKQPHLPEIPEDSVIERLLMMSKFRVERTKERLDAYYTVRSLIPEFYDKNPNCPAMQKVMDVVYFIPLPKLTSELNRVVVVKARDTNVENFDVLSYIAHTLNIAEIRLREDMHLKELQIFDLVDLKIAHFTKFTPAIIRKGGFVLEKVFANISHSLHFVNAPSFIDSFVSLLKTLLKPKLIDRVFVHKDMKSLHGLVPRSVLPKDYGGEEKSLEELNDDWRNVFLEYEGLFRRLGELKVNEELRSGQSPADDFFGVQGNFKQLNVD